MSQAPLIDKAALDELIDAIGDEGARSVVGLFVGESGTYLNTISAAAAAPDDPAQREKARRAAHSFKSGAGQVGAAAVAQAATAVEQTASTGGTDFVEAAATLATCTAETIKALTPMLG